MKLIYAALTLNLLASLGLSYCIYGQQEQLDFQLAWIKVQRARGNDHEEKIRFLIDRVCRTGNCAD